MTLLLTFNNYKFVLVRVLHFSDFQNHFALLRVHYTTLPITSNLTYKYIRNNDHIEPHQKEEGKFNYQKRLGMTENIQCVFGASQRHVQTLPIDQKSKEKYSIRTHFQSEHWRRDITNNN